MSRSRIDGEERPDFSSERRQRRAEAGKARIQIRKGRFYPGWSVSEITPDPWFLGWFESWPEAAGYVWDLLGGEESKGVGR